MSELILGPQLPLSTNYFDTTQIAKAKLHGEACPATPPTDANALNSFILLHYYDLPLSLYIAHKRTGDPSLLTYARKAADSWWKFPEINEGNTRLWPDSASPNPRHAGIGGLSLRALDGRPEMWSWIVGYTQFHLDLWLKRRINDSQLYYGLREGAFALHYATWVASALPDSYPNAAQIRAQLTSDIEAICINYFARLQYPDGSWRWNTNPDEFVDTDGGTLQGIMQPFMVGLLLSALVDVHQLTTSETVKENVKNQILKACRHLYSDGPYTRIVAVNFGVETRGFHYFYHGGTSVNPTRYVNGDIPSPWTTTERWHIDSARQGISTTLPAYAYAFKISGDLYFKSAYEEMFDSAYGGGDGFRSMLADTAKNYNQHARRVPASLVWIGDTVTPPPPPPPPPPPEQPMLKKVEWPSGEARQNEILEREWANGHYRMKRHLRGTFAEFEKID